MGNEAPRRDGLTHTYFAHKTRICVHKHYLRTHLCWVEDDDGRTASARWRECARIPYFHSEPIGAVHLHGEHVTSGAEIPTPTERFPLICTPLRSKTLSLSLSLSLTHTHTYVHTKHFPCEFYPHLLSGYERALSVCSRTLIVPLFTGVEPINLSGRRSGSSRIG